MSEPQPYGSPPYAPPSYPSAPPAAAVAGYVQPVLVRQPVDTVVVVIAWVLAVGTFGYLLPWAVAATRQRSNHLAIGLIDLFLGWTLIGWVAALVMALQSDPMVTAAPTIVVTQQVVNATPAAPAAAPGWYPSPSGSGQQYWDGTAWSQHTS